MKKTTNRVPESAENDSGLVNKRQVARAMNVSPRTVDNWIQRRLIPFVRISSRCIRFSLPAVMRALQRFEIKEVTR